MNNTKYKNKPGFTLIEIILVITILMTLVVWLGRGLFRTAEQAKVQTTKLAINAVKNSLVLYSQHVGHYPTTQEGGLQALVIPPTPKGNWAGPYLEGTELPKDAWGRTFEYNAPPVRFKDKGFQFYEIVSLGADGLDSEDDVVDGV